MSGVEKKIEKTNKACKEINLEDACNTIRDLELELSGFTLLEGDIVCYKEQGRNKVERSAYWKKENGKYHLLNYNFSLKNKVETVAKKLALIDPFKD